MEGNIDICIICDGKTNLKALNAQLTNKKNCIDMFEYCFKLTFPKNNQFGKYIMLCSKCVLSLKKCYKFRKQSELAYQRLYAQVIKCKEEINLALYTAVLKTEKSEPEFSIIECTNTSIKSTYSDHDHWIEDTQEVNPSTTVLESEKMEPEFTNNHNWSEEIKVVKVKKKMKAIKVAKNETKTSQKESSQKKKSTQYKKKLVRKKKRGHVPVKEITNALLKVQQPTVTTSEQLTRLRQKITDIQKSHVEMDEEERWSDWSNNTEEIFAATGFYNQNNKPRKKFRRPKLEKGSLKCPICDKEFATYIIANRHYSRHVLRGLCHICGKIMALTYLRRTHLDIHKIKVKTRPKINKLARKSCNKSCIKDEDKRRRRCLLCPMRFISFTSLKIHRLKEHGVSCQFYNCDLCKSKFYERNALKMHVQRVHMRLVKFFCDVCPAAYLLKPELINHIESKHGDPTKAQICEICGKRFMNRFILKAHMMVHSTVVSCEACGRKFRNVNCLKYHLEKNRCDPSKAARFVDCHVCGISLASRNSFLKHLKKCHWKEVFTESSARVVTN